MKNSNYSILVYLFIVLSISSYGQQPEAVVSKFDSESKLWLEGTSTLHDFTIEAKKINSSLAIERIEENETTKQVGFKVSKLSLTVPVLNLDSGKESMDENLREALMFEQNPNIIFDLNSPVSFSLTNISDSVNIDTKGFLTVAGTKKSVNIQISVLKTGPNKFEIKGKKKLLMTDFGVEPPSMFFGTVNTADEITVNFKMFLSGK